jgi:hypothetical protein
MGKLLICVYAPLISGHIELITSGSYNSLGFSRALTITSEARINLLSGFQQFNIVMKSGETGCWVLLASR